METAQIEVDLIDRCGSDLSVVNAARVSFSKQSELEDGDLSARDEKLIQYLAKHKHTSPFNHAFLSFRVKAPIFVARQLVKHKFLPWNEVSRRYVDEEPEFYFPDKWRKKADNVKQGSSEEEFEWRPGSFGKIQEAYTRLLFEHKHNPELCPEQARMLLPQNMMTTWIWSGTLGAFCDMLKLRLDKHTQEETRQVASLIAAEIKWYFPASYTAIIGNVV
jgi:thymidylate synthase (FAD)